MRVGVTEAEREIVLCIGDDATALLMKHFGGTRRYVPATIPDDHPICLALGRHHADKLAKWIGGSSIDVPKVSKHALYDRVVQARRDGKLTTAQIAVLNNLSERQVYRILVRARLHGTV